MNLIIIIFFSPSFFIHQICSNNYTYYSNNHTAIKTSLFSKKGLKSKQKLNEEKDKFLDDDSIETNISEELSKLNDLFQSGAITEDEFKKAKEKILNQ